jgi:hypothetical protein
MHRRSVVILSRRIAEATAARQSISAEQLQRHYLIQA